MLGRGFWELNTKLLRDGDFVAKLNETINDVLEKESSEFTNKRAQWDYLKFKVKEVAIIESKQKAKANRAEIMLLEKKVTQADSVLQCHPDNEFAAFEKKNAQEALDIFHTEKTKSLIIQSRTQFYEEGEKNNKFFLNMVKSNQEK